MPVTRASRILLLLSLCLIAAPFAFAQQTGSISGKVTATDGSALPGVTVEARSTSLPQPRTSITNEAGDYRLPALQPGRYTVTYNLAGMDTATRSVQVLLDADANVDVALGIAGVSESITVTADAGLIDTDSTEVKSALSNEDIESLPLAQDYRTLIRLAPAVSYTEDLVRGPSSGGSGQDNVYQFDGVNVTLPLFGTLASEPASHDIDQISVVRGGARAVDFNRAGGFLIDSVSKSGTSEFNGMVSYQVQNEALVAELTSGSESRYSRNQSWITLNAGGPILRDRLFFYGSYFRPEISDEASSNVYGEVPNYESERSEGFGKLTFTPTRTILLNGSYRRSTRDERAASVGGFEAGTASAGNEAGLRIGIFEGSWIINNRSFATAKYTDFENTTSGRPDIVSPATISTALGTQLDLNNLQNYGYFGVPAPISGNAAFNTFIAPIIERYGYIQNGQRVGGGFVGNYYQFDQNDFFRKEAQLGYDLSLGANVAHDLHFGIQHYDDAEDLRRTSNGWGQIFVEGGRINCPQAATTCAGQPVFYRARFQQMTLGNVQTIRSEYESTNVEINDTIRMGNWSFNLGVLASNDIMYGQGLREGANTITGLEPAAGNIYKMHEIDWEEQIQPRLGATWAYNGQDNVYASYARYNPAASSLPRAASWARNLATEINAYFDVNGKLIGLDQEAGSAGKLFQEGISPRTVNEYLIGTSQQITGGWAARAYGRYRYTNHFWEDVPNRSRVTLANAPAGVPREEYVPDIVNKLRELGVNNPSPNAYVIAELDGAFTKYYEATLESDVRAGNLFLRGSYTFSHYYGNFDQDNTTSANDANSFIGSSFIGDGAGRQVWDFRYGRLRGDRPHLAKLYGSYELPWNASFGAYTIFQSGHPWEMWSYEPYIPLTNSTSDSSRYAEPAGRRRTPDHYQLDVNYTQNIGFGGYNVQFAADVFNVFNKQTGYNPQPAVHAVNFGEFRSFYNPRRIQLAARFLF